MYIAGFRGDRAALKAWLSGGMPGGRHYFHLMGASDIEIAGDEARAVTPCINPAPRPDGGVCVFGHWYRDRFVRAPEGWRIAARELELCFYAPLITENIDPFTSPWVSAGGSGEG